jgi:hypothetical protein
MFGFCLGVNQNVVNEHYEKLVEILHEHFIHEVHKIGGGIGQPKRHHGVFIQSVTGGESGFGDIRLSYFQLMVFSSEINLRENSSSI